MTRRERDRAAERIIIVHAARVAAQHRVTSGLSAAYQTSGQAGKPSVSRDEVSPERWIAFPFPGKSTASIDVVRNESLAIPLRRLHPRDAISDATFRAVPARESAGAACGARFTVRHPARLDGRRKSSQRSRLSWTDGIPIARRDWMRSRVIVPRRRAALTVFCRPPDRMPATYEHTHAAMTHQPRRHNSAIAAAHRRRIELLSR